MAPQRCERVALWAAESGTKAYDANATALLADKRNAVDGFDPHLHSAAAALRADGARAALPGAAWACWRCSVPRIGGWREEPPSGALADTASARCAVACSSYLPLVLPF
ncbi:hypothetical protein DEF98_008040 [Xanthomonas vasicola]|nr:hypothetical protein DEF98_008040 [Xanthomonas vasicola]RJL97316.1 hypothetical protein DEF96_008320 [Xanthomonas vasicola]RJN02842.1 hypothetical protein DEF97_009340 [Xanthomonas vasicola]RJN07165.1 hypothetical protein DEF99_006555 [Xanthomonas vasicola]